MRGVRLDVVEPEVVNRLQGFVEIGLSAGGQPSERIALKPHLEVAVRRDE